MQNRQPMHFRPWTLGIVVAGATAIGFMYLAGKTSPEVAMALVVGVVALGIALEVRIQVTGARSRPWLALGDSVYLDEVRLGPGEEILASCYAIAALRPLWLFPGQLVLTKERILFGRRTYGTDVDTMATMLIDVRWWRAEKRRALGMGSFPLSTNAAIVTIVSGPELAFWPMHGGDVVKTFREAYPHLESVSAWQFDPPPTTLHNDGG